ncbi:hypothetical protein [Saccharopolyspora hattusasensis]|uniref:hypothetical protein n=1 Tax=Saccharopolyspora hattusasensis TaxID=1128679 RepID=UPI003D955884
MPYRSSPTRSVGSTRCSPLPALIADVAVNLHGCGPQSVAAVFSTRAHTILTHFHPAFPAVPGPSWLDDQHEVLRWCRMLNYYGVCADHEDLLLPTPTATLFPAR